MSGSHWGVQVFWAWAAHSPCWHTAINTVLFFTPVSVDWLCCKSDEQIWVQFGNKDLIICVILTPKGNYSLFNVINMNSKILYSTDSFGHSILIEKVPWVILVSWSKLQNNEYKLPMTFLTVGPRLPLCWWARKCFWSFFFPTTVFS